MTASDYPPMEDPLHWSLTDRPSGPEEKQLLKARLLLALWTSAPGRDLKSSDAFLEYYLAQRYLIKVYGLNLQTHEDVISLILFIRARSTVPRDDLLAQLNNDHWTWLGPAPQSAEHAVEIAVGIWLMIGVDDWAGSQTLQEYVARLFPDKHDTSVLATPVSLEFNAYNIHRIGGFNIVWTDCIQDHLSLISDQTQKELRVFHVACFLQYSTYSNASHKLFPPGFLEETIRTIALLFPAAHLECRQWLQGAQGRENVGLEAGLLLRAPRDLRNYRYWGQRLRELKDEYDRTEPTTIRQWVLDKRKPNQRYTFWIAVAALALALVFGLIQSVTGIVQAVAAVRGNG
ncbi:hypothetical protein BDW42DRAFT_186068 [Aspergillus taichungensis]|uniref:Uncharacterized protein n=1 Tax=Aspergillus taichungensis TaxID=482145 RepID=A0A2J5HT15_9EURO|nr:hypothetical protein BDW42DRAFT_186068 [Aspergillus taichungensis]